jgi:hypothetical protein
MFTIIFFYYIVVCSIAKSYTKPIVEGVLVYLYKMSILVVLEVLYNFVFSYKRLIVI